MLRTYRSLGIAAQYRPINDIHVDRRKIGGTAAAWIGEATVLGGSFLFDFDGATMARCLKVPSEKFRDKLATTLADYITSMAKLLPAVPSRPMVKQRYLDDVAEWLGEELAESNPTPAERAAIVARETTMADPAFVYQSGRRRIASGVKIAAGTLLTEGTWKAPGGLIRVLLLERDGAIADLDISGDFTCLPAKGLARLATRLHGTSVEEVPVTSAISAAIADLGLDLPGVSTHRPRPRAFSPAGMSRHDVRDFGSSKALRRLHAGGVRSGMDCDGCGPHLVSDCAAAPLRVAPSAAATPRDVYQLPGTASAAPRLPVNLMTNASPPPLLGPTSVPQVKPAT